MLKDEVLYLLEKQKGRLVTGGQLAQRLNVSRNAIWKAIRALQAEGTKIVAAPNKGYRLTDANDTLSKSVIDDALTTSFIGRSLEILPTAHSTNQYIKETNADDKPNGFVVIADEQTAGQGRRGRAFISHKGQGIYLSILLKLDERKQDIRLLTICAAVAVSKAIEQTCRIQAGIKWVNDVFCCGKKICGILTEATLSGELQELSTVVIGIGINTGSIPAELDDIATSIQRAADLRGIRNALIAQVLNQFEAVFLAYSDKDAFRSILEYYRSRLFIIGRRVLVSDMVRNYVATVLDIDDAGGLIVTDDCGNTQHITTGEIKLDWENPA